MRDHCQSRMQGATTSTIQPGFSTMFGPLKAALPGTKLQTDNEMKATVQLCLHEQ
jgi:hypothetical protein